MNVFFPPLDASNINFFFNEKRKDSSKTRNAVLICLVKWAHLQSERAVKGRVEMRAPLVCSSIHNTFM